VEGEGDAEAVPKGASVLARLQYPFVLDFRRHTILIVNYPRGFSPPPGMPFFPGPEPLVAPYLCDQHVRYVAYSYPSEANFRRRQYERHLAAGTFPSTRAQAMHTLDFQKDLADLGQTRPRVFDNGREFVLNLAVSSTGDARACGPSRRPTVPK
jgi:hypothetical protein